MQLSKARLRVNLLAQGLLSEWRVFAATRAKGRLSLVKERGRVRFDSHIPLIGPAHLHPLPLSQGDRRQSTQGFTRFRAYAARRRPNILWSHPSEPLQIV